MSNLVEVAMSEEEQIVESIKAMVEALNGYTNDALRAGVAVQIEMATRTTEIDRTVSVPVFKLVSAHKSLIKPGIIIPTR
jgi:hypothetical protein